MINHIEQRPLVCIIVLNWNGYTLTRECLKSLQFVRYPRFKTIVVDNGSSDGSIDKLRSEFGEVDVLPLAKNIGFAGGNNEGVRYAITAYNPEFCLLLNNDTEVAPTFLDVLVEAALVGDRIGAVVPKIYYFSEKNVIWYAGGYYNPISGIGEHYGRRHIDSPRFSKARYISFLNGCACLISVDAIRKVGLFDASFFASAEDTELSIRLQHGGYRIFFAPAAHVWHKVSATTDSQVGEWFRLYLSTRNTVKLQRQHARYHFPLFLLYFCFRWVLYMQLKYAVRKDFASCRALLRGLKDGFTNKLSYIDT